MTNRFYGEIGYGHSRETAPGVVTNIIVERKLYGDVIRNSRSVTGQEIVGDISVGNSIKVLADAYALEHFFAMKYVKWQGVLWTISKVDVEPPRLVLRLGGVYNGPTVSDNPEDPTSGNSGGDSGE